MPSSSFLHLTDRADIQKALERFLHHLKPGGVLAMSLRVMDPDPTEVDWEIEAEVARPADGALVRRWFRCRYEPEKRLQHTQDRYEIIRDGEVVHAETYTSSPFLTWYPYSEAKRYLEDAGFIGVLGHSDFTFEPATAEDTNYIVLGARKLAETGDSSASV